MKTKLTLVSLKYKFIHFLNSNRNLKNLIKKNQSGFEVIHFHFTFAFGINFASVGASMVFLN